ncbi:MAG: mannose-6-phosphate isomerase, class I [Acidimicrobiales bacterium]
MSLSTMRNVVRDYAWGSTDLIAALRGEQPSGRREAEVWMGAHPAAPSAVDVGGTVVALDQLVADDPVRVLGAGVHERFGRLPFLMKLLAAAEPLSLQAHPSIEQAVVGFNRENLAGIALDAPHRSYKDDNHKPELICALTPFRALVGFREVAASIELLESLRVAELAGVLDVLRSDPSRDDLTGLLRSLLTTDRVAGQALAEAVGAAVRSDGPFELERAVARSIARVHPGDPGIVTALLLNAIELAPGQAIHLAAGVLHAYVEGLGVEIMASSDNVLRGGLTPKHIDVDELCSVVDPTPSQVVVLEGDDADGEYVYRTPSPEFELRRLELDGAVTRSTWGPEIVVVTAGVVRIDDVPVAAGDSVFIAANSTWKAGGRGQLFRAVVPAG